LEKLGDFATELQAAATPPAGKVFAQEYFAMARLAKAPIDDLRRFRDATDIWSAIDADFQQALAEDVQRRLDVESPDWAGIATTCAADAAKGWKALAAADELVAKSSMRSSEASKLPAMTDAVGKPLCDYIQFCTAGNATGLVKLYSGDTTPPLLKLKLRKMTAASVILKAKPFVKVHPKWQSDPVKYLFTNPYEGDATVDVVTKHLATAVKLGGKLDETQQLHNSLSQAASGKQDGKPAGVTAFDEKSLTDDQLAAALAYSKVVADDTKQPRKTRLAYAARAARLSFRRMELSFGGCVTDKETNVRQDAIARRIQNEVTQPGIALSGAVGDPDIASLNFSDIRAKVILNTLKAPERMPRLLQCVDELKDSVDEAAALGLVAMFRYIDVYNIAGDASKPKVWADIRAGAGRALQLDSGSIYASVVLNYLDTSEFVSDAIPGVKPPEGVEIKSDDEVERAIQRFEATATILKTRKMSSFHGMRSKFLYARVAQWEKEGNNPEAVIRLRDQAKAAKLMAEEQKGSDDSKTP